MQCAEEPHEDIREVGATPHRTLLDFPAGKICFYCKFEGGMRPTVRVVSLDGVGPILRREFMIRQQVAVTGT